MAYTGTRDNVLQLGADGTGFDDLLKVHYADLVEARIPEETVLYNLLSKNNRAQWTGKKWRIPFRDGDRLAGTGARGEDARTPKGGRRNADYYEYDFRRLYGVAQFDNATKAVFNSSSAIDTIVNDVSDMMMALKQSAITQMDQSFFGDKTGVRAQIDGVHAAADVNTNKYIEVKSHWLSQGSAGAVPLFRAGDRIAIMRGTYPDGLAVVSSAYRSVMLSGIDTVLGRLYLDSFTADADLADGDYIVWGADENGNSYNVDIDGLGTVFEWGNSSALRTAGNAYFEVGGKTKSDKQIYAPFRSNMASPKAFDMTTLSRELTMPETHGLGKISDVFMHSCVLQELQKQIDSAFVFTEFDFNYFKGVESERVSMQIGNRKIPITVSKWVPYGMAVGFARTAWFMLELSGWAFDMDGGLLKNVIGYDHSVAMMRWYGNMGCEQAAANSLTRVEVDIANLPK